MDARNCVISEYLKSFVDKCICFAHNGRSDYSYGLPAKSIRGDIFMQALMCAILLMFMSMLATTPASSDLPKGNSSAFVLTTDFQLHGGWVEDGTDGGIGGTCLRGMSQDIDALTQISLSVGGVYHMWVHDRDFDVRQGTRTFQMLVDGSAFSQTLGSHGFNGFKWEKAGDLSLTSGEHMLQLHVLAPYARCDGIYLTLSDTDPNSLSKASLATERLKPIRMAIATPAHLTTISQSSGDVSASLQGANTKLLFRDDRDSSGGHLVTMDVNVRLAGAWTSIPLQGSCGRLLLIHSPSGAINLDLMSPSWPESSNSRIHFDVGGHSYETRLDNDPFLAGEALDLIPVAAKQLDAHTVSVSYSSAQGQKANAIWTMSPDRDDTRVNISFNAPTDGYYSVSFAPFASAPDSSVKYDLLPPVYQSRRRPELPVMMTNIVTSHPLALIETTLLGASHPVCLGVQAEPKCIPFAWPTANGATYGFSLIGPGSQWQPTAFAPVLGLAGSKMSAGQTKTVVFRALAHPGDWKDGLEYSSDRIDGVTDYRKPFGVSLTNAAFNIIDLMKNDSASGWDEHLKAFWQIESGNTVTEAYPLGMVSTAILTHDEWFYENRALPTIEYTLSRPSFHFAPSTQGVRTDYVKEPETTITVPTRVAGPAYWEGLYDLLGRTTPWIAALADNSLPAKPKFSAWQPYWSELLGLYRLHPSPKLLEQIQTEADAWIADAVYKPRSGSAQDLGFYNGSHYAYWWDLPDLYELTHDKRYLDAAEEAAFGTIGGLWSSPQPPSGSIRIQSDGQFKGVGIVWAKGPDKYRLGVPRKPNDTPAHDVPAWLVANQGLGLEGIGSYYMPSMVADTSHIFMSAWAPTLLRLYELTGRQIYQTYARNCILSRFGNYPGYYINGFTDLPLDPMYPYKGPDVTSIYYHHIPVHLGFTLDFLVEEARLRSHGNVTFPWVRQQGYVWFTNRIYGSGSGRVFDDPDARLWLDRKLASVTSPAINYLTARSKNRFWIVLMNESDKPEQAALTLDYSHLGIDPNAPLTVIDAEGKHRTLPGAAQPQVEVPAKGLIALSFGAATLDLYPAMPQLEGGRTSAHLDGEWGDMQAFRIRSPFGKDALYVVLTGKPKPGATAILTVAGAQSPVTVNRYPYEFTLSPWPMDKDLHFTLALTDAGGITTQSPAFTLAGTKR